MSDDSRSNSNVGKATESAGDKNKVASAHPNAPVPLGNVDAEKVQTGRKTAGLSERAEACMENGAVLQRFISLYTNGECMAVEHGE
jgi:hypothetical protein